MAASLQLVWSNATSNLKGWYWNAVKAGAIGYVLPLAIISSVLVALFGTQLTTGAQEVSISGVDPVLIATAVLAAILAVAISLIYYAGLYCSVVKHDRAQQQWGDILRAGRKNALRLLGFGIVTGLLIFLLALALIIPALIFGVFWAVAPIVFFQERGVINALKKSFHLVKGRWWRTFGYLLILFLLAMAVSIVTIPIQLFSMLLSLVSPVASVVLDFALQSLWIVFWAPFSIAYLKGVYDALSESEEA